MNDEIFLLSAEEYKKGEDAIPQICCWWWLQSPVDFRSYAAYVSADGSLGYFDRGRMEQEG